jgi:hypothetical protein
MNKNVTRLGEFSPIGRIFATWAIVYSGHFLKMTKAAQIVWLLFSKVKVMH